MMDKTSHSKCKVFQECMLRGYFKYILFATPEPKFKDYAFAGSYVHNCIDPWFKNYVEGDYDFNGMVYPQEHFTNTMQEIYRENSDTITEETDDAAIILCLDNFVDFMARRLKYVKQINKVDCFLPIFVEKEYKSVINGVPLHGYLDAGFMDDRLWLFDWKSNKDPKITEEYIKQATRYVMLTERSGEFDFPINDFYVINLRNRVDLNKAHVTITEQMKRDQEIELANIWELMNGTHFPKPATKKKCFFCEYKMRCLAYPPEGATYQPAATEFVEDALEDLGIIKPATMPELLDITEIDYWL